MISLPISIQKAIEALADLPGIGSRSAERLVFSLLKNDLQLEEKIAEALLNLKKNLGECEICHHYCETKARELDLNTTAVSNGLPGSPALQLPSLVCPICSDFTRDRSVICIVEEPTDLIAIERTHEYKGLYHVLHGVLSPMNKIGPDKLRIVSLIKRITHQSDNQFSEIIIALSGNVESDATALYLTQQLKAFPEIKITRLARGIPSGGDLDYLDIGTLSQAMLDRRSL